MTTEQPAIEKATPDALERTWIVSVVMVQNGPNKVNTQNKLYEITASETAEARGKARELAASDFPQHYVHTVCQLEVVNQSEAVEATYRALIAFVPLCAKCATRAAWIGSMSGVRLCDEHKRDSSYIDEAVFNAIAALAQVEKLRKR